MIGTLTTALGGANLRFANDNRLPPVTSAGKASFRRYKPCSASLHVADADPAVDSTCKRRYSLYEVLRVKRDATSNEIKAAYRNLAKRYHPDSCDVEEHDDGKFIEIHDAYATLYDPVDRAMYDLELNLGLGRRSGVYTTVGKRTGVYVSRRWETDQCW